MTLTRRRFLKSSVTAAFVVPIGPWFKTANQLVANPADYGLEIFPREAWAGQDLPAGPLEGEDVRFLLVHHTASGNQYQPEDVPGILRGFFRFHTGPEKGWPDVAYNFLIDRYGRVWEGRDGSLQGPVAGSATGGNQGYSQLVAVIGDFTVTLPTAEALDSLRRTLAWLADRDAIDTTLEAVTSFLSKGSNRWPEGSEVETATIAGHRDMSLTACPGDAFYQYVVDGLATDVSDLRASAITTTSLSTITTGPSTPLDRSSTVTSAAVTGDLTGPPSSSRNPISTDPLEAVSATETSGSTGGIGLGGLSIVGAATAAVLASLLALIRRRIRNNEQLEGAYRPALHGAIQVGDQQRPCIECGQRIRDTDLYCGRCGSPQGPNA